MVTWSKRLRYNNIWQLTSFVNISLGPLSYRLQNARISPACFTNYFYYHSWSCFDSKDIKEVPSFPMHRVSGAISRYHAQSLIVSFTVWLVFEQKWQLVENQHAKYCHDWRDPLYTTSSLCPEFQRCYRRRSKTAPPVYRVDRQPPCHCRRHITKPSDIDSFIGDDVDSYGDGDLYMSRRRSEDLHQNGRGKAGSTRSGVPLPVSPTHC